MRIVKLDAVDSTNDFLKNLCRENQVENFTVVTAENQTGGRGQMGSKWLSEPSQNLTASVLIKNVVTKDNDGFDLNMAIATSIARTLEEKIPEISIKWPNDILSGRKKIGGILIENLYRNDREIWSVAGFGINVNQKNFDHLPKASSICNVTGYEFDRDELLHKILQSIEIHIERLKNDGPDETIDIYHSFLFRRNTVSSFSDATGNRFNGIIRNVKRSGKLEIELDGSKMREFSLKEIELLY